MSGSSAPSSVSAPDAIPHPFEWPTWLLAALVYGGWLALTYSARALPWWLVLPAGAWIVAWHHSLQHELIHNHPTRRFWVNTALGFPPLGIWLPYLRYREMHLAHHRNELLTLPREDPESYYVTDVDWRQRGPLARSAGRFLNTVAGRIPFGPLVAMARFLVAECASLAAGAPSRRRIWAFHALGVAAVLVWVEAVCGLSLWRYMLLFVYPGFVLTALRSMAEHRAAADPDHRTAIVEHAPVLGLLFLFNNLHSVHHRYPAMAWYAIPRFYRRNRDSFVRRNSGLVYHGYFDVIRQYLFREHHAPVHPRDISSESQPVGDAGMDRLSFQPAAASP